MGLINDLFRRYGDNYIAQHGNRITPQQRKVIHAMQHCRTGEHGKVHYRCDSCDEDTVVARGCGNRHCPGCQHRKAQLWLQRQLARQCPGPHFMVTFTVPEGVRDFFMRHPREAYDALFAAAAYAMKKLAGNDEWIGGDTPGFFGVLHTWGRQLQYHPHIHFIAVGGAWCSEQKRWIATNPGFFLPVHGLSTIVRAKFRELMAQQGLLAQIPDKAWSIAWNVNSQAVGSAEATLKYLTPYVFRVAISDHRIVNVDDDNHQVTFWYRHKESQRRRTLTLDIMEFMRRFLHHVLPAGFMKIRYYGFLSPTSSVDLDTIRTHIELAHGFEISTPVVQAPVMRPMTCPHCGGTLHYGGFTPPRQRITTLPENRPPTTVAT